jgi:putative ABC transport system ATP-binding protein
MSVGLDSPGIPVVPDDWEVEEHPRVRVRNVNHHFGRGESRKQVLFANNLELLPGEIVIMTGPSGSGKTTLLTLIGALRSIQDGSLQVMGRELANLAPPRLVDIRRQIGFIFQAHNLFPALTAEQNVQLALALGKGGQAEKRGRATEILARIGLEHRLRYKPHALSGGQRQRVAIARALVNRPQLILADEPTAALDRDSGREVVKLLQEHAEEDRCTVLLVTHDNRILDVADRIVNMVDGHIVSNVAVKETLVLCEILTKCPSFANQPSRILSGVAEKMVKERFTAGSVIFRQGDIGDKFYLIRRGSCDVFIEEDGTRKLARTLGAGDFFGEIALLTHQPRTATIVARSNAILYTLGQEDFQALVSASTTLKDELLRVYFHRQ